MYEMQDPSNVESVSNWLTAKCDCSPNCKCECIMCTTYSKHRIKQAKDCIDCKEAAKLAYSDATTPGFFYSQCEKHRT